MRLFRFTIPASSPCHPHGLWEAASHARYVTSEPATIWLHTTLNTASFPPVDWRAPLTFALMTWAFFGTFPDVWIRNAGTLSIEKPQRTFVVVLSGSLLVVVLLLLTVPAMGQVAGMTSFPEKYVVGSTVDYYVDEFNATTLWRAAPMALWAVVSATVCVFITTVDTWLIGIVQFLGEEVRGRHARVLPLVPVAAAMGAMVIGMLLSQRDVLVIGFFAFPFLFMNPLALWLCVRTPESADGPSRLLAALAAGLAVTIVMECIYWEKLEAVAHLVILYSGVAMATVFALRAAPVESGNVNYR